MRGLFALLWLAGFVQIAIASANLFLPAKLQYHENLSRVSPIIRQILVVRCEPLPCPTPCVWR